jgi:DEAD/DEAH box helicase domain-containing protein
LDFQVVHVQPQPARAARYNTPSTALGPSTLAALAARGIHQLFVHQAAAVDALCSRQQHVVIATSTASGKSLCYDIPMLEELRHNPQVLLDAGWLSCKPDLCKTRMCMKP